MIRRLAALLLIVSVPAFAQSDMPPAQWANQQLPDPTQEAEAAALMEELRCLVCQGQSIADSNADMAGDMRHLVRARIAAGDTPAEVRDYLIERYGDWVSYRPSASRATLPLYLAPLLLLLGGAWLLRRRFKRRKSG